MASQLGTAIRHVTLAVLHDLPEEATPPLLVGMPPLLEAGRVPLPPTAVVVVVAPPVAETAEFPPLLALLLSSFESQAALSAATSPRVIVR